MIDRTQFTPDKSNPNRPVPCGCEQTVPTEAMAKLLADALNADGGKVLEIGTGSGFQTAVLAERCKDVVSVEVQPMAGVAEKLPPNVTLVKADGCTYDTGEKFDGVLVTFGAPRIMHAWFEQVREGGRLVVPLKLGAACRVCVYEKRNERLELVNVVAYAPFTEMVGA
jgi:protein-L-isoaspartate(D-aspartate) O-methyltransferase